MEEKFNEQFLNFVEGKRQLIPPKIKYDEIIATLQKLTSEKPKSMSRHETYLLRNYSLRIEQQKSVFYHHGERGTKEVKPRLIVAQEELFGLSDKVHKKIGHGGICLMWNELSGFYGISKLAFNFNTKI